jgi:uncharacterized protein (TIGR00251 family)
VRVKPGARKSQIVGIGEGEINIKVAALPVAGAANQELVRYVAEILGLARSAVSLVKGESSSFKTLDINGLTLKEIKEKMGLL